MYAAVCVVEEWTGMFAPGRRDSHNDCKILSDLRGFFFPTSVRNTAWNTLDVYAMLGEILPSSQTCTNY